jgi:hypothetical protein
LERDGKARSGLAKARPAPSGERVGEILLRGKRRGLSRGGDRRRCGRESGTEVGAVLSVRLNCRSRRQQMQIGRDRQGLTPVEKASAAGSTAAATAPQLAELVKPARLLTETGRSESRISPGAAGLPEGPPRAPSLQLSRLLHCKCLAIGWSGRGGVPCFRGPGSLGPGREPARAAKACHPSSAAPPARPAL